LPEQNSPPGRDAESIRQLQRLYDTPIAGVDPDIDPGDGMFDANREHYFGVGQSALRMVKLALLASGKKPDGVKQILDLPSGHGRVLRTLKAAFPQASLTACDIMRDGVDYCAREFGARPVYSRDPIGEVDFGGRFDLIWCGSLLTHLDAPRWPEFLDCFQAHLEPGGLLLFSVHGVSILKRFQSGWDYGLDLNRMRHLVAAVQESGFGYADYPNNQGYGISVSDREWVMRLLAGHRGLRTLIYCERGWDDHQDVVACSLASWQPPAGPAQAAHSDIDFGIRT